MDRLVYTALSGLRSQMQAQASIANNIANASTIGYRSDRVTFDRMVMTGSPLNSRTLAAEETTDADRASGTMIQTGRPLDVAVTGDSWIAVQATDGTAAYTRRGDLQLSPTGVGGTRGGIPGR